MAAKKPKEGSLVRIDLKDGADAFARVLQNAQVALYNFKVPHGADVQLSSVFESNVLFKLGVMNYAFGSGGWKVVDYRPLERELALPTEYFIQDKQSGRFSIYRSDDGSTRDSTYEECKDLEAAAVWDPEHIEERLRDHFAGRPSAIVERMRAKP